MSNTNPTTTTTAAPATPSAAGATPNRSLVKPTWTVLIVGWIIMLIPFPGTSIIGMVIAGTAGFILSIVNLVRGVVTAGVIQLICVLVVTPIVYFIAGAIYATAIVGAASH